jgi:hypothetical protein
MRKTYDNNPIKYHQQLEEFEHVDPTAEAFSTIVC